MDFVLLVRVVVVMIIGPAEVVVQAQCAVVMVLNVVQPVVDVGSGNGPRGSPVLPWPGSAMRGSIDMFVYWIDVLLSRRVLV